MEARVKERLTGAVVLVAIVVGVVPELLSGPKRVVSASPGSQTVKIDLTGAHRIAPPTPVATGVTPTPDPAATEAGQTVQLRPDSPAVVTASEPPVAAEPAPTLPVRTPEPPPVVESIPAAGVKSPDSVVADVPAKSKTASSSSRPEPIHPPPKAATPALPPRTAAAQPAAPVAMTTPRVVSGWVVQLGSFAKRENAQTLVQELHHKGYRAFVSEYRGKTQTLFRVRVGPEQDHGRADALKLRLGHDGYTGSVAPHP